MSHFTVLVIGDNIDKQLAPYHEYECTGYNDQYVQDVDVTQEVLNSIEDDAPSALYAALGYYGLDKHVIEDESQVEKEGNEAPHKWGYAVVKDGKLIKAVTRTNPNAEWDWYVIGGRWSNSLHLKTGGTADSAYKRDIDFDHMRNAAGQEAAHYWDKAAAAKVAAGFAESTLWEPWSTIRARHETNPDAARVEYSAQPVVEALRAVFDNPFHDIDQYLVPREQYVQQARDKATVMYAVVKDGQWLAKGDVGWWGMSDDKVSQEDWNRKVNEMLDALPDNTLITVVDCHI